MRPRCDRGCLVRFGNAEPWRPNPPPSTPNRSMIWCSRTSARLLTGLGRAARTYALPAWRPIQLFNRLSSTPSSPEIRLADIRSLYDYLLTSPENEKKLLQCIERDPGLRESFSRLQSLCGADAIAQIFVCDQSDPAIQAQAEAVRQQLRFSGMLQHANIVGPAFHSISNSQKIKIVSGVIPPHRVGRGVVVDEASERHLQRIEPLYNAMAKVTDFLGSKIERFRNTRKALSQRKD
ncbi:uncharacterized protein BJ171DRAFT_501204 [Polychytrium aggregatum]|uniref:uncharacterized protein n=1 Tax=Polychytrium aggregatum TaxID=110093 RepID=UPI0022FF25CF|nr:uncharacterized protein BJ171DRAFT_501204 [Polychytrium aggregatum]KAI9205697.1 hypothetical protein BJ171DRAFT_501204 [Polychytrium aggregatum]